MIHRWIRVLVILSICLIPLFNLIQGPRSDESKRQICFLVHVFHYSDDITTRAHRLSVEIRLLVDTRRHNKRFMESWFGLIAGGTTAATKREVASGNFNPHLNVPRRPQYSIGKHGRMARTKVTSKKEIKRS